MTADDVRRVIKEIVALSGDPEGQHSLEDELYLEVLEAIAAGTAEDPRQMAALAASTAKLSFPRWCA